VPAQRAINVQLSPAPAGGTISFIVSLPTELNPRAVCVLGVPPIEVTVDRYEAEPSAPVLLELDERRADEVKRVAIPEIHVHDPPPTGDSTRHHHERTGAFGMRGAGGATPHPYFLPTTQLALARDPILVASSAAEKVQVSADGGGLGRSAAQPVEYSSWAHNPKVAGSKSCSRHQRNTKSEALSDRSGRGCDVGIGVRSCGEAAGRPPRWPERERSTDRSCRRLSCPRQTATALEVRWRCAANLRGEGDGQSSAVVGESVANEGARPLIVGDEAVVLRAADHDFISDTKLHRELVDIGERSQR